MYWFSRLLLMLGMLAVFYCGAIIGIAAWPTSAWIIVPIVLVQLLRRKSGQLTTLGSARWADDGDLQSRGMLDSRSGLILGRLPWIPRGKGNRRIRALFSLGISAKEACRNFWVAAIRRRAPLVRLPQAIHTAVFSPSGGGKGVSFVVPFLMTCPDSCVVVDFKGENAKLTAEHRRKAFGHRVVLLDLCKVVTQTSDSFNPLDFINKDSRQALDECNDLANALVVRTGEEREPHWNDSAEAWIAAIIATVVQYGDRNDSRSLQMVRDMLSHPKKLEMAIKLMCESDCWGGMLSRMGGQLSHFVEKEKSSTLTTVSRHLRFLDTLAVADSTKTSSFDPADLRKGKMTVYLILPPEHMRAQSALLRMWIGSLLRAVIRGGLQEKNKVHFVLDEAASLGHLEAVDDAVDKYRGYGVRLQFYFQSLGQLKTCFPEGQEQTLLSNTSQVFFGVNDNATADYISARLGENTIIVTSGGTSSGSSYQYTHGAQSSSSRGSSGNASSNWQQQARKLLKPEEVIALPPRTAITFTPGVRPICTSLLRYYEERSLGKRPSWFGRSVAACATLAASTCFCLVSVTVAAGLTIAINDGIR